MRRVRRRALGRLPLLQVLLRLLELLLPASLRCERLAPDAPLEGAAHHLAVTALRVVRATHVDPAVGILTRGRHAALVAGLVRVRVRVRARVRVRVRARVRARVRVRVRVSIA